MAAGDYVGTATGTLAASGPATTSSVDVTVSGAAADSLVLITPTNAVSDTLGTFVPFVSSVTTNTVTVKANRAQLPSALTFRVIVWAGS